MNIQNNLMALNASRTLTANQMGLMKSLEKLSSGQRINRAGDDAAGLAISEKMRAQTVGLETALRNAQDGISLVQTAEGALTEVHSMLGRMAELATQASNEIYSDTQREALNFEFQALKAEVDRISKATNFNGTNLLDGGLSAENGGLNLQIGDSADPSNIINVGINDMSTGGLGLKDLNIASAESARAALGAVRESVNTVSAQRASLGALQNRQEHAVNNISVTIENLTAAESRIRDMDMAKGMMEFTKNNILMQASQAMLAHANMVPQSISTLLR